MIRRTAIAATGFLMLLSLSSSTQAQTTSSTTNTSTATSQQSTGGPFKKLRNKIRSMRPRIKRRDARKQAHGKGGTNSSTTPANPSIPSAQ